MNALNLVQTTFNQQLSSVSKTLSTSLSKWSPIILATSVTALLGLGVYRWTLENKNKIDIGKKDPAFEKVKDRVLTTYLYVFGGFCVTALGVTACHISGLSLKILNNNGFLLPIALGITTVVSVIATSLIPITDLKTKHLAWIIFAGSMGALISPIAFLNKALIAQAAFITLGVGSLLTLGAYYAPDKSFLKWEGPLITALTATTFAAAFAALFPGSAFEYGVNRFSLYGGIAIFSGLLMASTQRLMEDAEKPGANKFDPIRSSLSIYLDSLNLFVRILQVLAENKKEEKN